MPGRAAAAVVAVDVDVDVTLGLKPVYANYLFAAAMDSTQVMLTQVMVMRMMEMRVAIEPREVTEEAILAAFALLQPLILLPW